MLPTIAWNNGKVKMIDQRKLPLSEIYVTCSTYTEVAEAIVDMIIRGAPAIGVAAGFGIALAAKEIKTKDINLFYKKMEKVFIEFNNTRPTAVNLFWAIKRMRKAMYNCVGNVEQIKKTLLAEALKIEKEDLEMNKALAKHGSKLIKTKNNVLTYCNTGGLATAGIGTALGVIQHVHNIGKKIHVYTCETRPYLQGARLTTWELNRYKIPFNLITDNMAGYLMSKGKIDLVITGADRIVANGDSANKIGTFTMAVLAKAHKIPFYIAAPSSTVDLSIKTGKDIPIEQRNPKEVTTFLGRQIVQKNVKVINPAFDVTPHEYITAIITEKGVFYPPYTKTLKNAISKSS